MSGGGGGPSSTTVTNSNIPEYLRPQVETLLGGATKELFKTEQQIDPKTGKGAVDANGQPIYDITGTKDFTPYSTDPSKYVAGFSPLQQQVQYNAANLQMPGQYNQATGLAGAAGMGGMQSAQQAAGYGNAGFQSGQLGQQLGIQGGQMYGQMGAQAGLQGQQSGLLGQQLGIQGGQFYGAQGAGYGADAAALAGQAQGYGQGAADIGQMGLRAEQYGRDVSGQAEDYARQAANAQQQYIAQMTNPAAMQQFMSPYQQSVTDIQIDAARRQADISRAQRGSQAARAGAFGGARQAIENAEAERALQSQLSAIQAQGSQSAYDKAVQSMQFGSNLGLQGLQGAQQGLGTALQGGQLGLSGIGTAMQGQQAGLQGLQAANQLYGTGIQGAGLGLQGVQSQLAGTAQGMQGAQSAMQGAQTGLQGVDRQLAGTAQGMQGAQVGLQGVSGQQAGYGLANQSASTLGTLGNQQLAAQQGILNLQNQIGGQQQAQEQQIINQDIQNFANAQQQPLNNLNQFNALLRGYALPGTTTTQYQAQASPFSQIVGAGTTAYGLSNLTQKKKGGRIREPKRSGLHTLALRKALKG
jgi:hypothetical protein